MMFLEEEVLEVTDIVDRCESCITGGGDYGGRRLWFQFLLDPINFGIDVLNPLSFSFATVQYSSIKNVFVLFGIFNDFSLGLGFRVGLV